MKHWLKLTKIVSILLGTAIATNASILRYNALDDRQRIESDQE